MSLPFNRRQIETLVAASIAVITAVIGLSSSGQVKVGPKFVTVQRIARMKKPVYLTQPSGGGSALFVIQKQGAVRVISGDRLLRKPFLNIKRKVKASGKGDEQGMLSIAFSPDYSSSGVFYVAYTDHRDGLRIVEYRRRTDDPMRADRSSARLVLRVPEPTTKHHGGLLAFGPDGRLYIGSGDGGPSGDPLGAGQDKQTLRGKLLRIDPRLGPARRVRVRVGRRGKRGKPRNRTRIVHSPYTVPKDNPFVGRFGRDEIWSYGLRNPWRFSFDAPTNTIAIGDVGNDRYEELDILPLPKSRGANFGWSAFEGNVVFAGGVKRGRTVPPVIAYPHGRKGCAVVAGYFIRDPRLMRLRGRELTGRFLYGDYCTGRLFAFRLRRDGTAGRRRSFRIKFPYLSSFARDNRERIYILTEKGRSRRGKPTEGSVYRLVPVRKRISG